MLTTWVLFVSLVLGGKDDLWVYVENDPQTQSQHVRDALETPIDRIYSRFPTPTCTAFLDDLEWARCELHQVCNLHIQTRDEARLSSTVILPGYTFSERENPSPLHPQCYIDYRLVPEHLTYITRIRRYSIDTNPTIGVRRWLIHKLPMNVAWFITRQETTTEIVKWGGVPLEATRVSTVHDYRFPPCPPVDLPRPEIVTHKGEWAGPEGDGDYHHTERIHCDRESFVALLKAADMGTGIVYIPALEEEIQSSDKN